MNSKFEYLLRLGDNCLVLSQQLGAWCGHGPSLEEDLALTNVALDLLGHARMWLSYAGEVEDRGRGEDELAYLRDVGEFRNLLIFEQPNGHYGETLMRQFFFDAWHQHVLPGLARSSDERVAGIAAKASKEVRYHLERSAGLVVALGGGTAESRERMQGAVEKLWPFTQEWFISDAVDENAVAQGLGPGAAELSQPWRATVDAVFERAGLRVPGYVGHHKGGRNGQHGEHLGHLLSELQFLQRAHPGAKW